MAERLGVRYDSDPFCNGRKKPPVMTWAELLEHVGKMSANDLSKRVLFSESLAQDKPKLFEAVFVIAREEIDVDEWGEPLEEGTYFLTDREPEGGW